MRYRLLGDLLSIKSAFLYKRGYVDTIKGRNPSSQMNSIKTDQSSSMSFMEYNFKFKIDKGYYSSFDISDYLSDSTIESLTSDESSDIPSNLLMYQLSIDNEDRNYSLFEILNLGDSTDIIVNADDDIQKIEFYDFKADYEVVDGIIPDITEYNETTSDPLSPVPVMVVEFGPEISYEPEDYYNKDEMPAEPAWDEESRIEYLNELDEYYNKKFLVISTVSADNGVELNLSLSSHKSQLDPHKNQSSYVISNMDMKSKLHDKDTSVIIDSSVILDDRSSTILSTKSLDNNSLLILNEKLQEYSSKVPVEVEDKDGNVSIEYYEDYKDYVVYNRGDKVHYKGDVFVSLINGNLYENPSISPMWVLLSIYNSYKEDSEIDKEPHIVNIRVNDSKYGTTDPIGPTKVEYGRELYIQIITESSNIKSIKLDGVDQRLPEDKSKYTLSNVTEDHDLLIEFDPIYKLVTLTKNYDGTDTKVIGGGLYLLNSPVTIKAEYTGMYEFEGWYQDEVLVTKDEEFTIDKIKEDLEFNAVFSVKKMDITIGCSDGGTFLPFTGNPTKVQAEYTEYNSDFVIDILPFPGYESDYVIINSLRFPNYINDYLVLDDISEDKDVWIQFSRYRLNVVDPVLGRIDYVVIGDQLWSTSDVTYSKLGIEGSDLGSHYYSGFEMMNISNILDDGGTGFRVPSLEDFNELYSYFDEKLVGLNLKSSEITRFNEHGWIPTIYRGLGKYRFNSMPYGYYNRFKGVFIGKNSSSSYWTSTIDTITNSAYSSYFFSDSAAGFINKNKFDDSYLSIRLVADVPKINLLGKYYRYVTISNVISVELEESGESRDYIVTQDWIIDNFDYDELGVRFEESECGKFGSLYTFDEVEKIDNLLVSEGTGFRVPSGMDYVYLEKYLGYDRDKLVESDSGDISIDIDTYVSGYVGTVEGKRLKAGDLVYSGVNWNGYGTETADNSQLNILPSGYSSIDDEGNNSFHGMGTEAKFWTSTVVSKSGSIIAESRSISNSSDKILRGTDQGSKIRMSIRMVRTNIKLKN